MQEDVVIDDDLEGAADNERAGSPMRIFVREILDHNAPMDLETGQLLTRKVSKTISISILLFALPSFSFSLFL